MEKSETIKELIAAVLAVMKEVKNIDKSMQVGTGTNAYKGVPDFEVKKIIGDSMAKNGLIILPISISENTELSRWEEKTDFGLKQKQSVFTKVTVKYLLMHESGEYIELSGYGHGVDSQDKSAGKATTYALKYALLYSFMIPTGKIDDSDNTHSDNHDVPTKKTPTFTKIKLTPKSEKWNKAKEFLKNGGKTADIIKNYDITNDDLQTLISEAI